MRQVALFLVAVYGVAWSLFFALRPFAAQQEQWPALVWLLPTVWSPTIIALTLAASVGGAAGLRAGLRARLCYRRGSGRWLILAGLVPLATLIAVFTARSAGDDAPFVPSAAIPIVLTLQLVTGAIGEELGWRGFLLPPLARRFGEMRAAWVMGILWSLWHVPAFFFPGMPHQTFPIVSSLLFTAFFGVFLAFVFQRTGQSVLATMLAHLVLNITTGTGGVRLSSVVFWRAMVGIYGTLALLILIASRRQPRTAAQPAVAADR